MKKVNFILMAFVGLVSLVPNYAKAQNPIWDSLADWRAQKPFAGQTVDSVFIKIEDHNFYSRCFTICDANGDGIVTYDEAEKADKLGLDAGGRSNIIEDYSFLKYFPNLVAFSVGNTTAESIDLSDLPKLEILNLASAVFIKEITLAEGCNPQINYPAENNEVKILRPFRPKEVEENYKFWEKHNLRIQSKVNTFYLVSEDGEKFGLLEHGRLILPCKYAKEDILQFFFDVQMK